MAYDDIDSLRSLVVSPRESISSYAIAPLMILTLASTTRVLRHPPPLFHTHHHLELNVTRHHLFAPSRQCQYHLLRVLLTPLLFLMASACAATSRFASTNSLFPSDSLADAASTTSSPLPADVDTISRAPSTLLIRVRRPRVYLLQPQAASSRQRSDGASVLCAERYVVSFAYTHTINGYMPEFILC